MGILEPAPTRFDWNFRLFNTAVRVSGWFWVLPGVLGLLFVQSLGVSFVVIVAGCFFLSILLHEFGHVLAGRHFGAESYVVLNGLGGVAVGCAELAGRGQRAVVFLAGPLAQFLVGGTLWLTSDFIIQSLDPAADYHQPVYRTLLLLEGINLAWPLFNLLPVWPMDGWHVARELVSSFQNPNRPPWEQDADWWKRSSVGRGHQASGTSAEHASWSRRKVLLAAVLAVGLVVGWSTLRADRRRRRRQAFAELQQLGVVAGWDEGDRFYGFNFRGTNIGDEQLGLIELFDEIDHVDLAGTRVTDAGLRHLSGLRRLDMLYLQNTQVSDAGMPLLVHLKELRLLYLSGTQITDAGLPHLRPLRQLEWLSLSHTRVTDAGLVHIKSLPNLKYLHIDHSPVSEEGIADLKRAMPSLVVNPTGDLDDG